MAYPSKEQKKQKQTRTENRAYPAANETRRTANKHAQQTKQARQIRHGKQTCTANEARAADKAPRAHTQSEESTRGR